MDPLELVNLGASTFDSHRNTPEVSVDEHLESKNRELGAKIRCRTKVYLDTRFWVDLCDAELGSPRDPNAEELLSLLRRGVAAEKLLCPFSADLFAESIKRANDASRLTTAKLMDELSGGVTLQTREHRMIWEFRRLLHRLSGTEFEHLHPALNIWTKPIFVLGFQLPAVAGMPEDLNCAVQKTFADAIWNLGVTQLAERPVPNSIFDDWARVAQHLNDLNRSMNGTASTFSKVYAQEISGLLDLFKDAWWQFTSLFSAELDSRETLGVIFEVIRRMAMKGDLAEYLPTLHVKAVLAASVRWDKSRGYSQNELHDFGHACAALPYCDVFATEKSLHNLVGQTRKLDRLYRTTVVSSTRDLMGSLRRAL